MTVKEIIAGLLGVEELDENNPWIIWGAGKRGGTALHYLRKLKLPVEGFCDNDIKKIGTLIHDIPCYSKEKLEEKQYYILVSPKESALLYNELKYEYNYVLPGGIVDLFCYYPNMNGYDFLPPLGHFYSLYPEVEYVEENEKRIYNINKDICDINLNESGQLHIFEQLNSFYPEIPGWKQLNDGQASEYRYRLLNDAFSPGDAVHLHCMLRYLQPGKLIEVGSGWSSAVTLDTNEYYLNQKTSVTFIEPYAGLLHRLTKTSDCITLMETGLQEVPIEFFETLNAGDILFIDSTHVSKVGSDVNYLFFDILPRLKRGVYIHLHDIFYPFEYPKEWLIKGNVWNELYMLRAFLQNNSSYEIVYFHNMMEKKHKDKLSAKWPLKESFHGGSFWMKKL